MKKLKPRIFNGCAFLFELLLLVFLCFLTVCCERNQPKQVLSANGGNLAAENALDLNKASVSDLEKLPEIGPKRAAKIVEFREKYGKFRQPEEIILVEGMSDAKFRQIKNLVKVE